MLTPCPLNTLGLFSADIHLAEAGNTLIRNVDFEIPYFKKQAEKLQQQIGDQSQRHEEYLRNADSASKGFKQVQQRAPICPKTFTLHLTLAILRSVPMSCNVVCICQMGAGGGNLLSPAACSVAHGWTQCV